MPDADLEQTQTLTRQPPEQPVAPGAASNGDRFKPLSGPRIEVEVKDRLFREVKRQIFPREVEGILLQTQTGIPYWQDQLFSTMVDTWPRLETNLGKLKKAATSMEYEVKAYTAKGESPTDTAIAKANFVEAALFGMQSDTAWGFHDFKETVSDLIDSIISGLTVLEVRWESRPNLGMVPKYSQWIPARYYRYPYIMDAPDRLMLNPSGMLGSTQLVDFPPAQFLIGQVKSHANFPVYTAPMRCLTPYWIGARFGLEWFMTYAQLFGMPQRIAYYEPGDDQVYAELVQMMKASAAATWGVYPKGTEILLQAASNSGTFLPQERLIELADRMCDIMILGQTLTTDVQDSGSRALGSVHRSVLEEVYEAAARYASKVITTQLVPAIVGFNFGNQEELPVLQPVVHTPIDLLQISNAFNILFNQMKIPVSKQELYERIEFTPPEADQELYEPPGAAAAAPPMSSTGGGGAGEQADIGTEASDELALSASDLEVEGANPYHDELGRFTGPAKSAEPEQKKGKHTVHYHGSRADKPFDQFSDEKLGSPNRNPTSQWGHFFSETKEVASKYGKNVISAKLNLKNPYHMTWKEYQDYVTAYPFNLAKRQEKAASFKQGLVDKGHDGIIVDQGTSHAEHIAFYPHQIEILKQEKMASAEEVEGANPHRGEGGRFTSREKALYRVGERGKKIHKALPEIKDRFPQETQAANTLEQYFIDNADYISGIRWHSVMDDRTTAQCVHLNGKRWTYPALTPVGHSTPFPGFPPIFYNCRSHCIPVIRAFGRQVSVPEPEPVAAEEATGMKI